MVLLAVTGNQPRYDVAMCVIIIIVNAIKCGINLCEAETGILYSTPASCYIIIHSSYKCI